jgi:isopenicillin N synthase-like dioxygenase
MSIPQIDIAPFLAGDPAGRRAVASQWAQAFEAVGFATITGHGISDRMVEQVHDAAAQEIRWLAARPAIVSALARKNE